MGEENPDTARSLKNNNEPRSKESVQTPDLVGDIVGKNLGKLGNNKK